MIRTGKGLTTTFIVLGLVVTGGIAYGLLDGQLEIRTVYHSPQDSSGSSGK